MAQYFDFIVACITAPVAIAGLVVGAIITITGLILLFRHKVFIVSHRWFYLAISMLTIPAIWIMFESKYVPLKVLGGLLLISTLIVSIYHQIKLQPGFLVLGLKMATFLPIFENAFAKVAGPNHGNKSLGFMEPYEYRSADGNTLVSGFASNFFGILLTATSKESGLNLLNSLKELQRNLTGKEKKNGILSFWLIADGLMIFGTVIEILATVFG